MVFRKLYNSKDYFKDYILEPNQTSLDLIWFYGYQKGEENLDPINKGQLVIEIQPISDLPNAEYSNNQIRYNWIKRELKYRERKGIKIEDSLKDEFEELSVYFKNNEPKKNKAAR